MDEASEEVRHLDRECREFAAYLVAQQPDAYVLAKYREGHATSSIIGRDRLDLLDSALLRAATGHPVMTKLVDAYTAIFFKKARVRRKWMLLLAILETCAPTYRYFDTPDSGGRGGLLFGLLWRGLSFAAALGGSLVLFGPIHVSALVSQRLAGRH